MDRPKVGVGVIVVKDRKVLLGLRKGSHGAASWCWPGGHLEYGESWEQCAARELYEETGLKARNYRLAGVTNDIFPEQKHYITLHLCCEYKSGKLTLREPEKCQRWEWFSWDNLPSPLFIPTGNLVKQDFKLF